jgi:hypothetical protein
MGPECRPGAGALAFNRKTRRELLLNELRKEIPRGVAGDFLSAVA